MSRADPPVPSMPLTIPSHSPSLGRLFHTILQEPVISRGISPTQSFLNSTGENFFRRFLPSSLTIQFASPLTQSLPHRPLQLHQSSATPPHFLLVILSPRLPPTLSSPCLLVLSTSASSSILLQFKTPGESSCELFLLVLIGL